MSRSTAATWALCSLFHASQRVKIVKGGQPRCSTQLFDYQVLGSGWTHTTLQAQRCLFSLSISQLITC